MYNDRRKSECVNPRDRDNTLSIFIKGNVILVLMGIFVMVSSGWSISLNASEKPPFDIDWACNWIMGSAEVGNKNEKLTREIEAVNPERQTVKVVFKPAVTDWKVAQLSILDPDGSAITKA